MFFCSFHLIHSKEAVNLFIQKSKRGTISLNKETGSNKKNSKQLRIIFRSLAMGCVLKMKVFKTNREYANLETHGRTFQKQMMMVNAHMPLPLDPGHRNKMEYDEQVMVDIHLTKSYRFRWV